jgi:transposase-like protein
MTADLQNPAFVDDDAARQALEAIRWPEGPICPHCGCADHSRISLGQGKVHREGLYYCADCNSQFTVTVGTVMESSHLPLSKWLFAMHLMGASKKGMSALQLSRMLGITYKSAWFMCHRIREAMDPKKPGPLGGENKVVEADETFIGGKKKNRAYAKVEPKKHAVLALVDRDGESRSFHIADVSAKSLREKIVTTVSRKSYLATDQLASYESIGKEFSGHGTVNHSADEYVRLGGFLHINTAECRFSLMKRAVYGTHHSISEAHLHRYLIEWDFKWNTRKTKDGERAALIAKGIEGKRLTYRPTHNAQNA